VATHWT